MTCSYAGLSAIGSKIFRADDCRARDTAGRSPRATAASAEPTGTRASTTSLPARHVTAVDATLTGPPALAATGQAASSWTQPTFLGRDEHSHETHAPLVSRQPCANRPSPPYHRRHAQPAGHRLAVALRDCPGSRAVGLPRRCDHLLRCCANDRRSNRHNPDNFVLAAARQFAVDRVWCVITTHRVRVGCAEGLIYSSRGKIPVILWTSHQSFGERVLLWCRAGTSVVDFVSARAVLTAACWAQDVDIFFDTHNTHLVTLNVIRRSLGELISDVESRRSPEPPDGPHDWPGGQEI